MYLLLHRAIRNAGDYLIQERAARLLADTRPRDRFDVGVASSPLVDQFGHARLARYRAIIVAGGPGFASGLTRRYPLGEPSQLPPIIFLAGGSFVLPGTQRQLETATLPSEDLDYLQMVASRAPFVGTRDSLTEALLKRWNVPGVRMGGDPAWYDLDRIGAPLRSTGSVQTIAFTPPANPVYRGQAARLLTALRERWPTATISIVEHRGIHGRFARLAPKVMASLIDIGGSSSGMQIYDQVDLHVGYRVHAHLYSLSRGTPTYLVAEDSRGTGVLVEFEGLGESGFRDQGGAMVTGQTLRVLAHFDQTAPGAIGLVADTVATLAGFPSIDSRLMARIDEDLQCGFPAHERARAKIRQSLGTMRSMIGLLP